MVTTAASPRTRFAALAVRARNVVDSGLCMRTTAVPDWLLRTGQLAELAAALACPLRPALASIDDDTVLGLMVLSYGSSPSGSRPSSPGTWFEDLAQRAMTRTVNMTVSDLPPMTGEDVGRCGFCPSDVLRTPRPFTCPIQRGRLGRSPSTGRKARTSSPAF
ncbi:hypothetical protein [Streptomyces sp. NPDC048643]|uniref:hypothetical protein n=1 Tax=Streptomyces sp. NPDC048643 TaxID=3155637 RepID=UPI0034252609